MNTSEIVQEYKVYIVIFRHWFQIAPTWRYISEAQLIPGAQSWFTLIHPGHWLVNTRYTKVFAVSARLGQFSYPHNQWYWKPYYISFLDYLPVQYISSIIHWAQNNIVVVNWVGRRTRIGGIGSGRGCHPFTAWWKQPVGYYFFASVPITPFAGGPTSWEREFIARNIHCYQER